MKRETGILEWKRIGFGTAVGMIVLLSLTGLGAWLLERELVGLEWCDYLAALILLVSSFTAAKASGSSAERWLHPTITGAALWVVLALIHVSVFEGKMEGAGAVALAILGGSGAAILLGGGRRRTGSASRKRRYR